MSLASLNTSGLQTSNPSAYQTIKELIDQIAKLQIQVDSYNLSFTQKGSTLTSGSGILY